MRENSAKHPTTDFKTPRIVQRLRCRKKWNRIDFASRTLAGKSRVIQLGCRPPWDRSLAFQPRQRDNVAPLETNSGVGTDKPTPERQPADLPLISDGDE